jgi:hypothetical protein
MAPMSAYRIELARPEDDAALRARMAQDSMAGAIAVSFRREPSYFAACRLQGDTTQVVKCVERRTGTVIGMGSRSTAAAYVDGVERRIGYLSDLRLARERRSGTLLARGYRYFRRLHLEDPVALYTTVIYEGNAPAARALVGGRAGLPLYRDWGRVLTPALRLDLPVRQVVAPGTTLERGSTATLAEIAAFLNRWWREKQFAPVFRAADLGGGRFAGLGAGDFFVARREGRIVGTLAAWDQSALRQTHVESYSGVLRWLRPAYNALATVTPLKPLPSPGERIPYVYLAGIATEGNDVAIFRWLLRAALESLRGEGRWHYAIAGLHESDALSTALGDLRRIPAAGRLYVVHFPDEPLELDALAERAPYVEAACL